MPSKRKIIVFDVETVVDGTSIKNQSNSRGGITKKIQKVMVKTREIGVEQLEKNISEFMSGIQGMLSKEANIQGPYQLESIEVEASISAEGKIGFAGTGLGLSGSTGLKFVFTRKK